ncbi:UNVERIFIED_CONTAM: hypothetical protein K2H54_001117 [Gekko kuhli]
MPFFWAWLLWAVVLRARGEACPLVARFLPGPAVEVMSAPRREKSRSVEESSSGSSGSPSPGDTLPWNLAKHQRTKRTKSASGNGTVLDPAERAVIRIAGRSAGMS